MLTTYVSATHEQRELDAYDHFLCPPGIQSFPLLYCACQTNPPLAMCWSHRIPKVWSYAASSRALGERNSKGKPLQLLIKLLMSIFRLSGVQSGF